MLTLAYIAFFILKNELTKPSHYVKILCCKDIRYFKEKEMSEIISAIRLKDRIIIAAIMSAYALLLVGTAGAATFAGLNNHIHDYSYHLEKGDDGDFDLVGLCTKSGCKDPRHEVPVLSGVRERVATKPTCDTDGQRVYSLTLDKETAKYYGQETFTYTEVIPASGHKYFCEITTVDGVSTVVGSCYGENCSAPTLTISGATELKLESSAEGTCISPREEQYSYILDGVSGSFVAVFEKESTNHVLNGRPVSDYEIAPGVYDYGTYGIIPTDDAPTLSSCGQKTSGYYICEGCNTIVPAIIGLPDHEYVIDESAFDKATFDAEGHVTVKCTNKVKGKSCTDTKKVTLPKADESNVTLIATDDVNKIQTWKYSYHSDKYDITVEYEFTAELKHEHQFVHDPSRTTLPSLDAPGKAIVVCQLDDCGEIRQIVLPKVQIGVDTEAGDNATLIIPEATELQARKVRYTYTSEIYGFTEVLEITVGKPLSHAYVYTLEPNNNEGFNLIGRCNQPECLRPEYIDEENVQTTYTNTSTCNSFGIQIWSYTKNGKTYTFELPSFELMGHDMLCGRSNITKLPGFNNEGTAVVKCANDGCNESCEIVLPKVTNSDVVGIDNLNGTQIIYYYYTTEVNGVEVQVDMEFIIEEAHNHVYAYELEPKDGKFDFVGKCTSLACDNEVREKDVKAVLVKDTVSCTDPGYQTWSYVKDSVVYNCNIINFEAEGHFMDYDPDASTTKNPTFDSAGSIVIYCNRCDTQTRVVVLPKVVEGVNATFSSEAEFQRSYDYFYTTDDGVEITLILVFRK